MLDSVILLSEKLSELLRYREEKRAQSFDALIDPMYSALKAVHKDYLHIFQQAEVGLSTGVDLRGIIFELKDRRLLEEAERRSILSQADVFSKEVSGDENQEFFKHVVDYFGSTPFTGNNTPSNVLLRNLERVGEECESAEEAEYARNDLVHSVTLSLRLLRRKWAKVSEAYAKAILSSKV